VIVTYLTSFKPERFESDDDDSAIFILNLIVDDKGSIRYDPEPKDTLDRIAALLRLVKDVICSVPVIHSDLVSVPYYNSLMIVSDHEADIMLARAKQHLAEIFGQKMQKPDDLRQKFDALNVVLAEPYFTFPPDWHKDGNWTNLLPEWERIWEKCLLWIDEIEVLAEDEEDVGMFVAITSGSADQRFVTEILVNKARSLGDFIKETIEG